MEGEAIRYKQEPQLKKNPNQPIIEDFKKYAQRSHVFVNLKNVEGQLVPVGNQSFVSLKVEKAQDVHLIVLVHGYKGSEYDMRLYKNYIAKIFPHSHFLISKVNKKEENLSILKLGERLSIEVKQHINQFKKIHKISFIGHSLGGIVIRAALPHLEQLKSYMFTFISLSTPHLGFEIKENFFVSLGYKMLRTWNDQIVLKELDLADDQEFKKTAIYQLSKAEGLNWFKNLIFVQSAQDGYVNYESARIQVTQNLLQKDDKKLKCAALAKNILRKINIKQIHRLSVDIQSKQKNLKWLTGQDAHIQLLDNSEVIQTILYRYGDFLC